MIADPRLREDDEKRRGDDKWNGVLGAEPLGEGVGKDLPWTLSLRSRVTEGQGFDEGEASPFI